jgi:hypothetical protein
VRIDRRIMTRPFTLGNSNAFSPPGSRADKLTRRRGNSPLHEKVATLGVASALITMKPLDGVELESRTWMMAVVARLEDGLD